MTDINVNHYDEVFVKIDCERAIAQELKEFFSYRVPDAQFSPLYKKRYWDGKISLFKLRNHLLYRGLIKYLIEFASTRKYTIEFAPHLITFNSFSLEEAKDYLASLNAPVEARDYQIKGVAKAIRYKRITLLSPTSSGKSFLIYGIVRYLLEHMGCKKGLIIVPTINLVEQMSKDFLDYGEFSSHKVYGGQDKITDNPVVISTWQSIYDLQDEEWYKQFDFVVGDEAHTFTGKSLVDLMCSMTNARFRIGTTGTLDDTKVHRLTIEGLFGSVTQLVSTKQLMDNKQIAQLSIKCIVLKHPEFAGKQLYDHSVVVDDPAKNYFAEMDLLVKCKARNKFIKNLALSLENNTLILFQYVENHGRSLFDEIKAKAGDRVYFVYGGTEVEDREKVRQIAEKHNNIIIVASYGVFSQGINIRNLHNLILASPSKSKIRVLQSIGRALRLAEGKVSATLYDLSDDMRYQERVNYTLQQLAERMKIYNKEKFDVTTYNVELNYVST